MVFRKKNIVIILRQCLWPTPQINKIKLDKQELLKAVFIEPPLAPMLKAPTLTRLIHPTDVR